jgi:hypothetical protein
VQNRLFSYQNTPQNRHFLCKIAYFRSLIALFHMKTPISYAKLPVFISNPPQNFHFRCQITCFPIKTPLKTAIFALFPPYFLSISPQVTLALTGFIEERDSDLLAHLASAHAALCFGSGGFDFLQALIGCVWGFFRVEIGARAEKWLENGVKMAI